MKLSADVVQLFGLDPGDVLDSTFLHADETFEDSVLVQEHDH